MYKEADPAIAFAELYKEFLKALSLLKDSKYSLTEILNKLVMKHFCLLKEVKVKENTAMTTRRDYLIGKYLSLIYLTL